MQEVVSQHGLDYNFRTVKGRIGMKGMPTIRSWIILIIVILVLGAGLATIQVCADGGAMGSAYRTCDCRGWEWEMYDRTEADGPRRTLCLGWVTSRTCHQFRTGPIVECSQR